MNDVDSDAELMETNEKRASSTEDTTANSSEAEVQPRRRTPRRTSRGPRKSYIDESEEESTSEEDEEEVVVQKKPPVKRPSRSPARKPAAKRSKTVHAKKDDDDAHPFPVGTQVYKHFPRHGWFWGKITVSQPDDDEAGKYFYRVEYDADSDVEEMGGGSDSEAMQQALRKAVVAAANENEKKQKKMPAVAAKPARKKQKVAKPAARKKKAEDDSESEFEKGESEESEVEKFDAESSSSEEEQEVVARPRPNKRGGKAKTKSTTAKKEAVVVAKKEGKKSMAESFRPFCTPLYQKKSLEDIAEEKEYLDPCGMEATDDIIDQIVGAQVDKIAPLLKRVLSSKGNTAMIGSILNPLTLGTACSGTDAPALALTLVKEQLELRGMGHTFSYSHQFSCELDPFKQAYLARNFDSTLYPDITKMTEAMPRDVYGRDMPVPAFNMFVAGTSCKNFSMLRSTRRIDIEDKGCSGETFLAATEILFKEKPAMAIFENVQCAPWVSTYCDD
jgi:hypothetical protein